MKECMDRLTGDRQVYSLSAVGASGDNGPGRLTHRRSDALRWQALGQKGATRQGDLGNVQRWCWWSVCPSPPGAERAVAPNPATLEIVLRRETAPSTMSVARCTAS